MSTTQAKQIFKVTGELQIETTSTAGETRGRLAFVDSSNNLFGSFRVFGQYPFGRLCLDSAGLSDGIGFRTNLRQGATSEGGSGEKFTLQVGTSGVSATSLSIYPANRAPPYVTERGQTVLEVGRATTLDATQLFNPISNVTQGVYKAGETVYERFGTPSGHALCTCFFSDTGNNSSSGNLAYLGYQTSSSSIPPQNLIIKSTGNIEIPSRLDVGTIKATTYENLPALTPAQLSPITLDQTNNRVGINQPSPTADLDVVGSTKLEGTLVVGTDDLTVSLTNHNTTVRENLYVGLNKIHLDGINGLIDLKNATILTGTGTPEGNQIAIIGSIYMRQDGGPDTVLYIKTAGVGNTGWVAVSGGSSGSNCCLVDKDITLPYTVLESDVGKRLYITSTTPGELIFPALSGAPNKSRIGVFSPFTSYQMGPFQYGSVTSIPISSYSGSNGILYPFSVDISGDNIIGYRSVPGSSGPQPWTIWNKTNGTIIGNYSQNNTVTANSPYYVGKASNNTYWCVEGAGNPDNIQVCRRSLDFSTIIATAAGAEEYNYYYNPGIVQSDNKLVCMSGNLQNQPQIMSRLRRFNLDCSLDNTFNSILVTTNNWPSYPFQAITQDGNENIYVYGQFTVVNTHTTKDLVKFDKNGNLITQFTFSYPVSISSMISRGNIVVDGEYCFICYIADNSQWLDKINATTGTVLWHAQVMSGTTYTPKVYVKSNLIAVHTTVSGGNTKVFSFDQNGTTTGFVDVTDSVGTAVYTQSMIDTNGDLYFGVNQQSASLTANSWLKKLSIKSAVANLNTSKYSNVVFEKVATGEWVVSETNL